MLLPRPSQMHFLQVEVGHQTYTCFQMVVSYFSLFLFLSHPLLPSPPSYSSTLLFSLSPHSLTPPFYRSLSPFVIFSLCSISCAKFCLILMRLPPGWPDWPKFCHLGYFWKPIVILKCIKLLNFCAIFIENVHFHQSVSKHVLAF